MVSCTAATTWATSPEAEHHAIPPIDLVVVDLYPFEETVASGAEEQDVIEKIDIGGISLLRAAAKNYRDVLVISSRDQYAAVTELLTAKNGATDLEDRRHYAAAAFATTSHYDTEIFKYVSQDTAVAGSALRISAQPATPLRYGENPHQAGTFYGDLTALFDQLHGKQLSYNNLVDVDAAVALMAEFTDGAPACAILKHTNACGVAQAATLRDAYVNALSCDPTSAFGGVIIVNKEVDAATAAELNQLFFEVLIAPSFAADALPVLQSKKNRILLLQKPVEFPPRNKSKPCSTALSSRTPTARPKPPKISAPSPSRHLRLRKRKLWYSLVKSASIPKATPSCWPVPAQLLASGVGQTSRVDALRQAIEKAAAFGFDLKGAVMASDAFFPFPDCVEIAGAAGIRAVVQPGGSIKDADSIKACDDLGMAMVLTGVRHFKH